MKTSRIVADTFATAFGENPDWTALIASSDSETVEVVFETMKAPLAAASILASSQEAVRQMAPATVVDGLGWHLDSSLQMTPDALDVSLLADGEVLCINVGSGAMFFKLTDRAKKSLKNL